MSLDLIGQADASAGIFPASARHLIPDNGLYDLLNGLLDDDGSIYRRGGSQYLTTSGLGAAGLTFLWDGYLAGGARTVVATPTKFGVLSSDDSSIIDLGGAGLTQPKAAVEIGGVLLIGGGTMYGGSLKTADYSAATVSVTNGSKVVTGAATLWAANIDKGMLLRIGGVGRYYVVESVDSDTQVTLRDAYEGSTAAGQAYVLSRLGTFVRTSDAYLVVADRVVSLEGNRAYFSRNRSTGVAGLPPAGQLQYQTFDATDYHEIPEGLQLIGGRELRGNAIIFATRGVFVIANMALGLTDASGAPQQRLERLDRDFVLWANEGIASFGNQLVVPGVDGAYMIDGISAPDRLTRSLGPFWTAYVRGGRRTGLGAVYRGCYLLPILDTSNTLVDFLVCRLDRPVQTRLGMVFPWMRLSGAGAAVTALAVRARGGTGERQAKLFAAMRASGSRVLDCSGFFEPAAGVKVDHDGSVHVLDAITKDYAPGAGAEVTVKKVRLRSEMSDAASDGPLITGYVSKGARLAAGPQWGAFTWGSGSWTDSSNEEWTQMSGQAPAGPGREPFVYRTVMAARYLRFRFRSVNAAAKLAVRSWDADIRKTIKR